MSEDNHITNGAEFAKVIEKALLKIAKVRADTIEMMCEKSLLDEKKRGVLVHEDHTTSTFNVTLDESVPFGQIHYRPLGFHQDGDY